MTLTVKKETRAMSEEGCFSVFSVAFEQVFARKLRSTSRWSALCKILQFDLTSWCGNCAFPQSFSTRKLGEISVFHTVQEKIEFFTIKIIFRTSRTNEKTYLGSLEYPNLNSYKLTQIWCVSFDKRFFFEKEDCNWHRNLIRITNC